MFQLALLGSGSPAMVKGSGPNTVGSGGDVNRLAPGDEGMIAGFSGELQSILMQMSPQMLEQLEELLAGGMPLPQAARSLLSESGFGSAGELFGDLLEEGLMNIQDRLQVDGLPQGPEGEGALARLAGNLLNGGGNNLASLGEMLSAPIAGAMAASGQNPVSGVLPPQLAASLLDMGVPQTVGAKGWSGAISDRVMWMIQGEQQFAKLRLNPPNLGPLEVRIAVHQDQASVSFLAQHAAVREALEAALPRLREMFDQQSLQLVRADVSDPGAKQGGDAGESSAHSSPQAGPWGQDAEEGAGADPMGSVSGASDSLVDLFA